jgi:hypothetical protein
MLECTGCGQLFERRATGARSAARRGRRPFCSQRCLSASRRVNRTIGGVCAFCGEAFSRPHRSRTKDAGVVCSVRCSAGLSSQRHAAARQRGETKIACPCGQIKRTGSRRCQACRLQALDPLKDRTLGELQEAHPRLAYHAKVRGLARAAYRGPMQCMACGYSLHVDICHVRAIADFPLESTLREVNHPDNLMALDKRCHWEYDHGHLALRDGQLIAVDAGAGVEPANARDMNPAA